MKSHLPDNILCLFKADPPIDYIAPIEKKSRAKYDTISTFMKKFQESPPKPMVEENQENQEFVLLRHDEIRKIKRERRYQQEFEKINEQLKLWDPYNNPKATNDAYNTVFVGRLSYKVTEDTLIKALGQFGKIKMTRIVHDLNGKPRGYAFVEFEDENDMKACYMKADAMDIEGRPIVVDVERGRTVPNWKPRRFGGNHGSTRMGGDDINVKRSGRHKDGEIAAPPPRDERRSESRRGGSGRDMRSDRDRGDRRDYRSDNRDYRDRERYDRDYRGRDNRDRHDRYDNRSRDSYRNRDRGNRGDRGDYRGGDRDRYGDRDRRRDYRPY